MNFCEEAKGKAFTPINENPIVLDFGGCGYLGEVHRILREKFGLPQYYGENWDALWDCLRDLFQGDTPVRVLICGFTDIPEELQNECEGMLAVFQDVQKEMTGIVFERIS